MEVVYIDDKKFNVKKRHKSGIYRYFYTLQTQKFCFTIIKPTEQDVERKR